MRHWLAANLFMLAFLLATVGSVFISTEIISRLGLSPLGERVASVIAALVIIVAVGLLFRKLLRRLQRI